MGFILCFVYDIIYAGEIYTHTKLNFTKMKKTGLVISIIFQNILVKIYVFFSE